MLTVPIVALKICQQPSTRSWKALQSPWYTAIPVLQDATFHTTTKCFKTQLVYKHALTPVTTDSINASIELRSNLGPVRTYLHGE